MGFIYFALLILFLAMIFLWQAGRRQKESGLPGSKVIYADTSKWGKPEKPLFHEMLKLTGRPDYLVQQGQAVIPVEVKSTYAPPTPYESHLFQLAAYCLLVEEANGKRPPYGILHYQNRTYAIDYSPQLESDLLDILVELRQTERLDEVHRSHQSPARCARCGYRQICDQRL